MKKFVVHPEHINVMLWAGMEIGNYRGRPITWKENPTDRFSPVTDILEAPVADYVGQMLLDENRRAVGESEPLIYVYRRPAHRHWSLLEVLSAIECYETQNIRDKHWRRSVAHAFCRELERAVLHEIVRQLPNAGRTPAWHLTDDSTPTDSQDIAAFPVPIDPGPVLWGVVRRGNASH